MRKQDLIQSVASTNTNLPKKLVGGIVDDVLLAMSDAIVGDGELVLRELGSFRLRKIAARNGRNPMTGESVKIPKKTRVKFKAGKALQDAVNGN